MPVEIEEIDGQKNRKPLLVEVTLICEGCGETIEKFEMFEDRVGEELEDSKPIHSMTRCEVKAMKSLREEGD